MEIPQAIVDELSSNGIDIDSDPKSLCRNRGRNACFIAGPASSCEEGNTFVITGTIIGCELELDTEGRLYILKLEIDKKDFMDKTLIRFEYNKRDTWQAIVAESSHPIKGDLFFPDL